MMNNLLYSSIFMTKQWEFVCLWVWLRILLWSFRPNESFLKIPIPSLPAQLSCQFSLTFNLFLRISDLLVILDEVNKGNEEGWSEGFGVETTLHICRPLGCIVKHSVSRWQHSGKEERTFNNLPARQCSGNCGLAHLHTKEKQDICGDVDDAEIFPNWHSPTSLVSLVRPPRRQFDRTPQKDPASFLSPSGSSAR